MNILDRISDRVPPYVALIPVCVGVFVAADDQTVIVTVLPQIMLDMEVPITEIDHASWAITGYLLGYLGRVCRSSGAFPTCGDTAVFTSCRSWHS